MRVFISYSFQDEELYLLSLLIDKLQVQGHQIRTTDFILENNRFHLNSSDLFIGIVTNYSDDISDVLDDWDYAKKLNKKTILLIEEGVHVNDKSISFIRFNRNKPEGAINQLLGVKPNVPAKKKSDLEDGLIIGGIIVGIAALISLLAGTDKK
jgi:hypothetical protein